MSSKGILDFSCYHSESSSDEEERRPQASSTFFAENSSDWQTWSTCRWNYESQHPGRADSNIEQRPDRSPSVVTALENARSFNSYAIPSSSTSYNIRPRRFLAENAYDSEQPHSSLQIAESLTHAVSDGSIQNSPYLPVATTVENAMHSSSYNIIPPRCFAENAHDSQQPHPFQIKDAARADATDTRSCNSSLQIDAADESMVPDDTSSNSIEKTPPQHSVETVEDGRSLNSYAMQTSEMPKEMIIFLDEVRNFYTKAVNMERQKTPLKINTYRRVEERIKCYLGFAANSISTDLTPAVFLQGKLLEQYFGFLKDERQISPATISNHAAALLYPAKLLNWDKFPDFTSVKIIRQLRSQVSLFQRMGNLNRPSTKEELMSKNKWLDWPDVLRAVSLQRDRLDMAGSFKAKAKESSDLLLMAIYTLMPPSRALEIRTLKVVTRPSTDSAEQGQNTVCVDDKGVVKFRFENYKTVTTYGADETILEPSHEICHIMKDFLKSYWKHFQNEDSGDHLFVNAAGKPYSSSAFSAHIKFLFRRVTGVPITINVLRSSFLTHAYSQKNCNDSAKDALASALRHSRRHAQGTYDKRTSQERKEIALGLAAKFAGDEETTSQHDNLKVGDFVGLIEEESTVSKPLILIGQIRCFLKSGLASLLWFKEGRHGIFSFVFDEKPWEESPEALFVVKMEPVRGSPGAFRLKTDPKLIHRSLSEDGD